ncbi:MAG: tetratricopeptide repeat protein [Muribaculaceae bacterium]|nr:tetratricopeptide repeat protein [Muribaculaceae bacterium]
MTHKISELHSQANDLLDSNRIFEAISIVRVMLEESGVRSQIDNLLKIEQTYKYMIHYLIEGAHDEGRDRMLSDISGRLRMLSDMAVRASMTPDSPDYYYAVLRFVNLRKECLSDIISDYGKIVSEMSLAELGGNDVSEMRKRKEEQLVRLFNSIFVSFGSDSEYAEIARYLASGYADGNVSAQSISALTLSLLCFYDKGKFSTLLDIYDNTTSEKLAARTLVGIVLSMVKNAGRIASDRQLMDRLSIWKDSIITYRRLHEVIRVIVGTRDTERVSSKMKDEVIPEIMKLRPDILKKLKESDGDPETMMENNPEWEEMLSKSDLTQKMRELSELQSDGADLMMVTFSGLKQFPFFNTAANWFLPFDSDHSEIKLSEGLRKLMEVMRNAGSMICDSDMYSLALAFAQMPDAQKNMISGQISAQIDQFNEETRTALPSSNTPEFDTETLKSVRDLYRFFKLFRKREGLKDPFARPLNFIELPVIGEMMNDNEMLELIGEFYFKRGYYADALVMLTLLTEDKFGDASLWEKIGFCHQAQNRMAPALDAYEKASLIKTPGPWLIKKLAYVNRRLGNYRKASEYYLQALQMDPDNVSLLMNSGNMLLESGDTAAALTHYYHANYISPDSPRILRAIAWAELLSGNFSKSSGYYGKVTDIDARPSDYLNAGHSALLRSDRKEAVRLYRLSADGNKSDFEMAFISDMPVLESLGADRIVLQLVLDTVLAGKED